MTECSADLYWMPVGAGTSGFQQASLRFWESIEAAHVLTVHALGSFIRRSSLRSPGGRVHAGTDASIRRRPPPLATGPVGIRGADRIRLFRYQLRRVPGETLPDEEWAEGEPIHLTGDCDAVRRIVALAPSTPPHVWGRRVRGTKEMWTSDSVISWLLRSAGIDLSKVAIPPGGRAPGWSAGIALAATGR
ncbi:MAG: hypothetical protein R3B97_07590 [Dehalococcoidia bacterium]